MATPIEMKPINSTKGGVAKGGQGQKREGQPSKGKHRKLLHLIGACREGKSKELSFLQQGNSFVNYKIKGTTLLHEACSYGSLECVRVLMKVGACPTIWDVRGFTPAHSAIYNNHLSSLQVVLGFCPPTTAEWSKLHPDTLSQYDETLLHIACLRGNFDLAQFLLRRGANVLAVDRHGNTVLHYAASCDVGDLVEWAVGLVRDVGDEHVTIDTRNIYGQTAAHRACVLGCPASLRMLVHYSAELTIQDTAGYTPVDLARLLGNAECYEIGRGHVNPNLLPPSPQSSHRGSVSRSSDNLLLSQSFPSGRLLPQRSLSNASSSTPPLQRHPSITGGPRPHNLAIRRQSKGSFSSLDESMYVSKATALQVGSSFKHKKTRSWDNAQQMLYNDTAYEPPPDILFIKPIEKETLKSSSSPFYNDSHDIKIRIAPDYWQPKNPPPDPTRLDPNLPSPTIDLCVAAAMHLNQPFPQGYTIVSPVYFISCRSAQPCQAEVTLPHATEFDMRRLCILSTTTVSPPIQGDLWSPSDRMLSELDTKLNKADQNRVKFRTSLGQPSLYAVAVNEKDYGLEPHLPLRCALFVSYPDLKPTSSVSGLYVTTYVGMSLKTVRMAVAKLIAKAKEASKMEERTFILSENSLKVEAKLNNQPSEWKITPLDNGMVTYNQVALTQETDKDSVSHLPSYLPHSQFFVEPQRVAAAVKCRVGVVSPDRGELVYLTVIPFSPSRELTPPPSHPPTAPEAEYSPTVQNSNTKVTIV